MTHTLPDIEPLEKVKVGRAWKYKPTDKQVAYIKAWVTKVNIDELAAKMGVSTRTMKTILTSLNLTKNKTNQRKRNERKSREQTITNTAKRIAKADDDPEDATLFIAGLQTGKDLNGVPLNNEHRLAIDAQRQATEYPNANQNLYVRVEVKKNEKRRRELIEQRKEANVAKLRKKEINRFKAEVRKQLREAGEYQSTLESDIMLVAVALWRLEKALDDYDLYGNLEDIIDGKGATSTVKTAANDIVNKAMDQLAMANQKLSTNANKWDRMTNKGDTGGNSFFKEMIHKLDQIGED